MQQGRTRPRAGEYGESMEQDDLDVLLQNLPPSSRTLDDSTDARLARRLQEIEDEQGQGRLVANRDCAVCGDSSPIADFPSLANCTHRPETCAGCYEAWITTQLQDSSWREAKCPVSKCGTTLTYHEIQQYATAEIFQQYDTFIARAALNEDRTSPGFEIVQVIRITD